MPRAARSYLYVTGDHPDRLAKASDSGADALIADLESTVAAVDKAAARAIVAGWLATLPTDEGPQIWVRVNNTADLLEADVRAVALHGLAGIMLPKTTTAGAVSRLDVVLEQVESDLGLPQGEIAVIPIIETAAGVFDARPIAGAPRVSHLALGEADLCAELGLVPSPDSRELVSVRMQVVLACAAAGINPPLAPTSSDVGDHNALRASTIGLKRMGFGSRPGVHPAQIPFINDVFTPTSTEITEARDLLSRYDDAMATTDGELLDSSGRVVDDALIRAARRTLALIG